VTIPANYDGVSMSIEPGPLNFAADGIQDSAQSVVHALDTINKTLNDLQLSWDGKSAAEAHDFADRWQDAMTGMFGTKKDAKKGVMNQVIIALKTAVGNFSNGENGAVNMFLGLQSSISGGALAQTSETSPIAAGASGTFDMSLTAITEINWTGLPGS
jgi:uncharacterized protein YukE